MQVFKKFLATATYR